MAMNNITFDIKLFTDERGDKQRSQKALLWLLEALCQVNLTWLASHPRTPPLYKSSVIYVPEKGTEIWRDIPTILEKKVGDCEDLACYRVAELRYSGVNARPYIKWRRFKGTWRYHAVVWLPGGRIEDPSLALGMSDHPITRKPEYIAE